MSRILPNIFANYTSRILSMLLSLGLTPLYVRWLGLEAFGLIGIFNSIQAILAWLDIGISPTLARSLSQLSANDDPDSKQRMRDLVVTFGIISTSIGVAGSVVLIVGAPFLSHWFQSSGVTNQIITQSIILMGISIALQWPTTIFQGGLMAIEHQVAANALTVITTLLRAIFSILVIFSIAHDIRLFLIAQATAAGIGSLLAMLLLFKHLPKADRPGKFSRQLLISNWRFAAGMTGTAITATLSTQVDTIILTRILSLRDFGVYSLAKLISNSLSNLNSSIANAFYPKYCQLSSQEKRPELASFYHLSSQALITTTFSICLTLAYFPFPFVFLWTGSPATALSVSSPMRYLLLGAAGQSLLVHPFFIQLANGWTDISMAINLINLVITAPITIIASLHWGLTGAGIAWLIYTTLFALLYIPRMHKRVLINELCSWFFNDFFLPVFAANSALLLVKLLLPPPSTRWLTIPFLALASLLAFSSAVFASHRLRPYAFGFFRKIFH